MSSDCSHKSDYQAVHSFLSERAKASETGFVSNEEIKQIISESLLIGDVKSYYDAVEALIKNKDKPVMFTTESFDGTFILKNNESPPRICQSDLILTILY
jgi:hypothetical protein